MPFHSLSQLPFKEIVKGVRLKSVYIKNVMMTFFELDPHSEVPLHSHPHEQITFITRGCLEMTIEGKSHLMRVGDIATIPPHAKHTGRALEELTEAVDAWYPVREDYIIEERPDKTR